MVADKLMVVAHPDDECLFGGAQLLTSTGWKVLCVTNGDNEIRRKEFTKVMHVLNCEFEIWNYYDSQFTPFGNALFDDLKKVVVDKKWNKIVTHNFMGEYGHLHHMQINEIMKRICPNLWTFNFFGSPMCEDIWLKKLELIYMYESQREICLEHIQNVKNEKITRGSLKQL